MVITEVVLLRQVCAVAAREMRSARGTETGGALVGFVEKRSRLVVTDACGPGRRATLDRYGVVIDGIHAAQFCDRARTASGGRDDYVGDWHCHLSCIIRPSEADRVAMATMSPFVLEHEPVSVIWAKWSGRIKGYIYDIQRRRLRRIHISRQ